jgi:hypothetical protein
MYFVRIAAVLREADADQQIAQLVTCIWTSRFLFAGNRRFQFVS